MFKVGATIQAFIDTAYFDFDYGFAVVKNQKVDIVPTIGISSVKVHVGAGLAAQTTLGGGVSRSLSADASDRSIFPVPGVQFAIRPHPHIDITRYTRFIKATLQGVTNSSWDGRIGLEFPVAKHVGGGAAYYFNHITQSGTHDTFSGNLHYTFRGPQLYGLVHF